MQGFLVTSECEVPLEDLIQLRIQPGTLPSLTKQAGQLVDAADARNRYYHPSQHGSWSLKSVLPAAVPDLSYDNLHGVANGGMAVAAYQEAINTATTPERKRELEAQLHAYCNLDTLALVRLWKLFSGIDAAKVES